MADQLTADARALIDRPVLATLTTLFSDGSPQSTPLWITVDGDDLVVNTSRGRVKERNMARDPRVSLVVIDPDDAYRVVVVRGTVTEMTEDGADAVIDQLAHKYLGVDTYPNRQPDERRVTVTIRTDRIVRQPT
jgi:PPOX class probable F420-dependent enzyme